MTAQPDPQTHTFRCLVDVWSVEVLPGLITGKTKENTKGLLSDLYMRLAQITIEDGRGETGSLAEKNI